MSKFNKPFCFFVALFFLSLLAACRQEEAPVIISRSIPVDGYMPISWVELEAIAETDFDVIFSDGTTVSGTVFNDLNTLEVKVAQERTCSFFERGVSQPIREVDLTGVTCDFDEDYRFINVYAPTGSSISKVEGVGRYVIYSGILFPVDSEMVIVTSDTSYQVVKTIPEIPIINSGEVRYVLTDKAENTLCQISYYEGGMGSSGGESHCIPLLTSDLTGITGFSGDQGGAILLGDFEEVKVILK